MTQLKNKVISGASWSLIGKILQQGSNFIFGIILARLLLPKEYGLVAMAMVFIVIFQVFVDSGFGTAIVQRKEITNRDLSTIFFLNLGISILSYIALYYGALPIANFYNEPELVNIIRVLSLLIILFALTIVQNALITKEVKFKLRARIELVAQVLSSSIAIYMAFVGWGVWAIVWKTLLNQIFVNIQLWVKNNWFPTFQFSKSSFKELFGFSSKLLLSGILERAYSQVYRLIVGKFFPAAELGYYTRAEQFKNLPTQLGANSLLSFLLPVFSKIQDDKLRIKKAAKRVLKIAMFLNINTLIIMGIAAKPLIGVLLGEKWMPVVPYLQLLIFVGIFYPMHAINVQILTSLGRSDLFLKIEIIKKTISIPTIFLAIFIGIKAMIIGMIATSLIGLIVNTYYTNKLIDLGLREQFQTISKSILTALSLILIMSPFVFYVTNVSQITMLTVTIVLSVLFIYLFARILKFEEYFELKGIILEIKNSYVKKQ